jgi:hypothetical protein
MTKPTLHEHAVEVDTRVASAWSDYNAVAIKRDTVARDLSPKYSRYISEGRRVELEARLETLTNEANALAKVAIGVDAEYEGWNRFFLVQHIHSSQHCSSFRPTTRIGWLPNLSGLTEAEAVAEHGAILCTICFPSAPTEWTMGKEAPADQCEGSGTSAYNNLPRRLNPYGYGNWVTCPTCAKTIGVRGSAQRIPKHKVDLEALMNKGVNEDIQALF